MAKAQPNKVRIHDKYPYRHYWKELLQKGDCVRMVRDVRRVQRTALLCGMELM